MLKEIYSSMNEQIFPSRQLLSKTIEGRTINGKRQGGSFKRIAKPAAACIALLLCLLISLPALLASVPAVYDAAYLLSPAVAQFFKPVRESCVSNGIKMEVVSAYVRGNTAQMYVSLTDLEGDRVDATTDLFDSYSIRRPFSSAATCAPAGFDEATKTATFLLSITEWENQAILGDKITFSVGNFISGKQTHERIPIALSPSIVSDDATAKPMPQNGGGGNYAWYFEDDRHIPNVLPPAAPTDFGVEGIALTGAGYADGMLHVQLAVKDFLRNDNHGDVFFEDARGRAVSHAYNVHFIEFENEERIDYCEFVFDIPKESLGEYALYGNFTTSAVFTQGNWQVTFPLEPD